MKTLAQVIQEGLDDGIKRAIAAKKFAPVGAPMARDVIAEHVLAWLKPQIEATLKEMDDVLDMRCRNRLRRMARKIGINL